MKAGVSSRFNAGWFILLLTLPGDLIAGFFLVGGPSLENVQWWRFGYLMAVYAALFLVGKLMASYSGGVSCARGICVAAMHGLGVVAGASFRPASIRVEGVPFALHPTVVYLGALAVFLYASALSVVRCHGKSGEGVEPGKIHSLPFWAVVAGLAPAVIAWIPMQSDKPSAVMPFALFALAIAGLNSLMLWRVYPRYISPTGLEARHLRNLIRIQAALVVATSAAGANVAPALATGLGIYVLSSVFNYLYKPLEDPIAPDQAEKADVQGAE